MELTPDQAYRILLVEDDKPLSDLITFYLKEMHCVVDVMANGEEALRMTLEQERYDLIILDVMLPGMNGLEILQAVREIDLSLPILMLTARDTESDKVRGLELGADDYLTKPFGVKELVARIQALLRRSKVHERQAVVRKQELAFGELLIRPAERDIILSGTQIELTAREFDLLYFLASNMGQAFNRHQLLDSVWGYRFNGFDHTITTHVNRLRLKLKTKKSSHNYIKTVWGFGYMFSPEDT